MRASISISILLAALSQLASSRSVLLLEGSTGLLVARAVIYPHMLGDVLSLIHSEAPRPHDLLVRSPHVMLLRYLFRVFRLSLTSMSTRFDIDVDTDSRLTLYLQFFITTAKADFLDGKHVVFGKVIDGLITLRMIENVATGPNNRPKLVVKITGQSCNSTLWSFHFK